MPLQIPVLDDRRFADLVLEGRALIPTYAPEWTNHNPSDPGVTLVELFAHIAELLIYRLDRVTAGHIAAFLNLLDGQSRTAADLRDKDVAAEIRATIQALRKLDRAVSEADFEALSREADPRVERARCVPRRNLVADLETEKPGHVSVIVLPTRDAQAELPAVAAAVHAYLEPRVLLTTRLHVVGSFAVRVTVSATVVPVPDQTTEQVRRAVVEAVLAFLDPHAGGEQGRGWPFGRNVFRSELFALLDRLPEVDYVKAVSFVADPAGRLIHEDGRLVGVEVRPHEIVDPRMLETDVAVEAS